VQSDFWRQLNAAVIDGQAWPCGMHVDPVMNCVTQHVFVLRSHGVWLHRGMPASSNVAWDASSGAPEEDVPPPVLVPLPPPLPLLVVPLLVPPWLELLLLLPVAELLDDEEPEPPPPSSPQPKQELGLLLHPGAAETRPRKEETRQAMIVRRCMKAPFAARPNVTAYRERVPTGRKGRPSRPSSPRIRPHLTTCGTRRHVRRRFTRRLLVLVAMSAAQAACGKREAPSSQGAASAANGAVPPIALVAVAAPSPFSVAAARLPDDESRFPVKLAALAWETRVFEAPDPSSKTIGYVRAGGVVRAASAAMPGEGCHGEWRAISPAGYVCLDAANATADLDHPLVHALSKRADPGEKLPYMYGVVRRQGPIYARLPTRPEAEAAELELDDHMHAWLVGSGKDGAGFRAGDWLRGKTEPVPSAAALWEARTTEEVPDWLSGSKFPPGNLSGLRHHNDLVVGATKDHNAFALIDTAVADGRRYGITSELLVYPVDRMRPVEGSTFAGYRIPEDIDFPFALVRRDGAETYALHGKKLARTHELPRRSAVRLSGAQRAFDGVLYFQTADGLWVSERFVSRVDGTKRMPKWAVDGERWLDVSIAKQALLAYDGTKAVYATLVSTGEAGLEDPATSRSTVRGAFRIFVKHLTTTMASTVVGEEFELKDIPYVQYFSEGYALHAAYWHDDFGIPRSHGCINLSPADAKWLFQFTLPQLPRGWHGVRTVQSGSVVYVHS